MENLMQKMRWMIGAVVALTLLAPAAPQSIPLINNGDFAKLDAHGWPEGWRMTSTTS